jgi:hypothetical protein
MLWGQKGKVSSLSEIEHFLLHRAQTRAWLNKQTHWSPSLRYNAGRPRETFLYRRRAVLDIILGIRYVDPRAICHLQDSG